MFKTTLPLATSTALATTLVLVGALAACSGSDDPPPRPAGTAASTGGSDSTGTGTGGSDSTGTDPGGSDSTGTGGGDSTGTGGGDSTGTDTGGSDPTGTGTCGVRSDAWLWTMEGGFEGDEHQPYDGIWYADTRVHPSEGVYMWHWGDSDTNPSDVEEVYPGYCDSTGAVRLKYNNSEWGAMIGIEMPNGVCLDFSSFTGLTAAIKVTPTSVKGVMIQVQTSDGKEWGSFTLQTSSDWQVHNLPFSSFKLKDSETTGLVPSKIKSVRVLSLGHGEEVHSSGDILIDDVGAYGGSSTASISGGC